MNSESSHKERDFVRERIEEEDGIRGEIFLPDYKKPDGSPTQAMPPTEAELRSAEAMEERSNALWNRYQRTDDISDLQQAIGDLAKAIELSVPGELEYGFRIGNLGRFYSYLFQETGDLDDLEKGLASIRQALPLTANQHWYHFNFLFQYALMLGNKFEECEEIDVLEKEIEIMTGFVEKCLPTHPDFNPGLNELGNLLQKRFELRGNLSDIDLAIDLQRRSIDSPEPYEGPQATRMSNLGRALQTRFENVGNIADIQEAIALQKRVLEMTPEDDPDLPIWLTNMGSFLSTRYRYEGRREDVEEAVAHVRRALELSPDDDPAIVLRHCNVGANLILRFGVSGDFADMDEAIAAQRKAMEIAQENEDNNADLYYKLGQSLEMRFDHKGNVKDIEECISFLRQAVDFTPSGSPEVAFRKSGLGTALLSRFIRLGNPSDLEEAITLQRECITLTPSDHPERPRWLKNLGDALRTRFNHRQPRRNSVEGHPHSPSTIVERGAMDDIEESIALQRECLKKTPASHSSTHLRLSGLGLALATRFDQRGDLPDIKEAISLQIDAVKFLTKKELAPLPPLEHDSTPRFSKKLQNMVFIDIDNQHLASVLSDLGNSYQSLFNYTGDVQDIDDAIAAHDKAVTMTPADSADLPTWLNDLANAYHLRFNHSGDLTDIEQAISIQQRAVHLTPPDHVDISAWLNNLGTFFLSRFERTLDLPDIEQAISVLQRSIQLTPTESPGLAGQHSNLGLCFQTRFEHTGKVIDIAAAIESQRRAIQLTSEDHFDLPKWLNNVGISLQKRFQKTGVLQDADEAIDSQRKAVELAPEGNVNVPKWLQNLGNSLRTRFEFTNSLVDVEEAIKLHVRAVELTEAGYVFRPDRLLDLGKDYLARSKYNDNNPNDAHEASNHFRAASTSSIGVPSVKLEAAQLWARTSHTSESLEAYDIAIHLLSQVAGLAQTIQNRHASLGRISNFTLEAAAAAFSVGRLEKALEWLDQGRCLTWSQLNNLRTPLDDLRLRDAALADRVSQVSRALEKAGSRSGLPGTGSKETTMEERMSAQDETLSHVTLAKEWESLLETVRNVSGFENFLRPPPSPSLLQHLPESGFVVVVNVHKHRCDGLVLGREIPEPLHVPLATFSHDTCDKLRAQLHKLLTGSQLRARDSFAHRLTAVRRRDPSAPPETSMRDVLSGLWVHVARPILQAIGLPRSPKQAPRIWWCTTGPLAFLPLHAAGVYTPGQMEALWDYAVSSYIPTVTSLTQRVSLSRQPAKEDLNGLFMVSQPNTPGLGRIPGTTVEVARIQALLRQHHKGGPIRTLLLESEDGTRDAVLSNLDKYNNVHLACHAIQDTDAPLDSGFFMYDGPLELSTIIKKELNGRAGLAFLSACQTSAGDEKLSEEAVHLAAGMLAAGYRGVVATMWSIGDQHAPKLAEDFYRYLLEHGEESRLDGSNAAYALDHAVQNLRESLDGTRNSSYFAWVPYVHFGL